MVKEYNYQINKVIDKDVLIKWFYAYPPCAKEKYHNELAKYMYVTPTENSQLINFYEDHVDYKIAIEALQIEEFPSSGVARFSSHRELDQFLVFLSTKEVNKMSKEELNQLLLEFRMSKSLI
jgi:hypothetical protein